MMNTPSSSPRKKIGAGKSVVNRHECTFKKGSLMFIEGETSREMYIIRSGKIRILKQEGENAVELAVLGPGSVLGELSLLDSQPRSATGQVLEETAATIIDEELFDKTMSMIPSWMNNIIKLVVTRLRETMKRAGDDLVRKNVAGVIRVMLLLNTTDAVQRRGVQTLPLDRLKETIYAVIGLGGSETENVLMHLILKEMLVIQNDGGGKEYIVLHNPEVLRMYMNYLRAKSRNAAVPGEAFTPAAGDLIDIIYSAGEKNGTRIQNKVISIGIAQVEIEHERRGKGQHVDLDTLDQLLEAKVVMKDERVTESAHGKHKRTTLVYNEENLKRMRLFAKWLPMFKEEVLL